MRPRWNSRDPQLVRENISSPYHNLVSGEYPGTPPGVLNFDGAVVLSVDQSRLDSSGRNDEASGNDRWVALPDFQRGETDSRALFLKAAAHRLGTHCPQPWIETRKGELSLGIDTSG